MDASRAPSTGTTSAKENIGEMENKGLEFQVDGMLVQRNDFYWQVAATGSMNRNRILKINSALKRKRMKMPIKVDSKTPLAQYEGRGIHHGIERWLNRRGLTRQQDRKYL